jgi:hypothetical protein
MRSGNPSQIDADVETFWLQDFGEHALAAPRQFHQIAQLIFGQSVQIGRLLMRTTSICPQL